VYNSIHRHSSIQIPSDNLLIYKRNTEEPMPVDILTYSNRRRLVLKNPNKADLNKDGNLSSYEKKRGKAIETAMGKAYGGTVKKYAMGGGVRKVRKDNY